MPASKRLDGSRVRPADRTGPWRPARFASVVVEEMMHRIVRGDLPVGSVLPTEPALGAEFGFSRTVVREALKLLEERGLVRIEQGRGTTVQQRDSWNLLDPLVISTALVYDADTALLDDLIRVRRLLEREMARGAATRLTSDDLVALEENVRQMESHYDDYATFQAFDHAFHAIVMKASGSEVGYTIVRAIHSLGGARPEIASPAARESLERTANEHSRVFEALRARDGELAATLMAAHIDSAWAERRSGRST